MKNLLKKINSKELFEEARVLYDTGLQTINLGARYRYFQEAKSLEKIAKEIWKYETMQQNGDL